MVVASAVGSLPWREDLEIDGRGGLKGRLGGHEVAKLLCINRRPHRSMASSSLLHLLWALSKYQRWIQTAWSAKSDPFQRIPYCCWGRCISIQVHHMQKSFCHSREALQALCVSFEQFLNCLFSCLHVNDLQWFKGRYLTLVIILWIGQRTAELTCKKSVISAGRP